MIHSKRSQEGYLLVDHRNSPGITEADLATVPADRRREFLAQSAGHQFEAPTLRCAHCGTIVVLNPARTRPRHWCSHCDHYVCDSANCILVCNPLVQRVDRNLEQAARLLNIKEV